MEGDVNYDAEWQPMKDFIDKDRTMNQEFLHNIKEQDTLGHLHRREK